MPIFQQFFNPPQTNKINESQFKQLVATLNKDSLQQLVAQARQKGIPEKEIEAGIQFILSLR